MLNNRKYLLIAASCNVTLEPQVTCSVVIFLGVSQTNKFKKKPSHESLLSFPSGCFFELNSETSIKWDKDKSPQQLMGPLSSFNSVADCECNFNPVPLSIVPVHVCRAACPSRYTMHMITVMYIILGRTTNKIGKPCRFTFRSVSSTMSLMTCVSHGKQSLHEDTESTLD